MKTLCSDNLVQCNAMCRTAKVATCLKRGNSNSIHLMECLLEMWWGGRLLSRYLVCLCWLYSYAITKKYHLTSISLIYFRCPYTCFMSFVADLARGNLEIWLKILQSRAAPNIRCAFICPTVDCGLIQSTTVLCKPYQNTEDINLKHDEERDTCANE